MMRRSLAALMLLGLLAVPAMAQSKVAIANPMKILQEAQETKDFQASIQSEQTALQQQDAQRVEALKALQAKKDQIKPDAPQWNEVNKQIVEERSKYQSWKQAAEYELGRKFREHAKKMHAKISDTIAAIAKERGFDAVIAEQKAEVTDQQMEQLNPQQMLQVLFARNVLYRDDSVDLTQEVLTRLNQSYKPSN